MKILYLYNKKHFDRRYSISRTHYMEFLGKQPGVELTWWGIGYDDFDETKPLKELIGDKQFDFIFVFKPLQFQGWSEINTPVVIEFNELIDRATKRETALDELIEVKPTIAFGRLKHEMKMFQTMFPNIIWHHIPHSANENIFKDYGLPKIYDATLIGSLHEDYYPFRQRLYKLLPKLQERGLKAEYKFFKREPDQARDQHLIDLAKFINQSKVCMTCSSFMEERLAKMVEIPASGTVLACDPPHDYGDTFCPAHIVIEPFMTDEEILDTLKSYLQKPDLLEQKKNQSLKWAKDYTMDKYAKNVVEYLKN